MDFLVHFLFEDPTPLCIVFALGALIAGVICKRAGSNQAMAVAMMCVVLAAGVALLAWLVETDREKVLRTLNTMAAAGASGSADKLIERISPAYQSGPHGKDDLAAVVRKAFEYLRVEAGTPVIKIRHEEATVTQTYRLLPAPGSPALLPLQYQEWTWQGTFAPDGDREWRLRSAMAIQPERVSPEDAAKFLQHLQ